MSAWDKFYLDAAKTLSIERPDPVGGKCVGAVIVKNGKIIGIGTRYTIKPYGSMIDRTIHAEHMAIDCAGADAAGATLYCTMEPCARRIFNPKWYIDDCCVTQIIKSGIVRVVFLEHDDGEGCGGAKALSDAGVEAVFYVHRED